MDICKIIRKVVGKGVQKTHEPMVYGNEKKYYIHLRTDLTFAPWQYYSYSFNSPKKWIEIRAPFKEFKKMG